MKVVDKSVRKALNESNDNFIDKSMDVYDTWLKTCNVLVKKLEKQGKLYHGMDSMDAQELIEDDLMSKLDKAFGGNWQ